MDGQKVITLIDSGAQVLSISSQFCEDLTLQIQPLGRLLKLEGTWGSAISYLRYVEVNLQIPGIKNYNKDVLLLVIPTMTYSEKVLVMVGSKIIDWAMGWITKGELSKVTTTWRQAHFRAIMSRSLQLPHTSWNGTGVKKEAIHSSPGVDTLEMVFCLDNVWGPVCTTLSVTAGPKLPTSVVLTVTNGELHFGSSWVPICLENLSTHSVEIPAKAVVGQVMPANQVPPVVLLAETSRVHLQPWKGMDLGGPGPPRPRGMAWNWTRTGQGSAAQMGTPIFPQLPRTG